MLVIRAQRAELLVARPAMAGAALARIVE